MILTLSIIALIFLLILCHLKRNQLEKERDYYRNIFRNKYSDDKFR